MRCKPTQPILATGAYVPTLRWQRTKKNPAKAGFLEDYANAQIRSQMVVMPWPPPMHMVAMP